MADWKSDWNINVGISKAVLRTVAVSIQTQGNTGTPSVIDIQLEDAVGAPLSETFYCRVRVANGAGYTNATNATFVTTTGTLVETYTATKDLVIKSNASGLIRITVTDAVAETFLVLLGAPSLLGTVVNLNNSQSVVHA